MGLLSIDLITCILETSEQWHDLLLIEEAARSVHRERILRIIIDSLVYPDEFCEGVRSTVFLQLHNIYTWSYPSMLHKYHPCNTILHKKIPWAILSAIFLFANVSALYNDGDMNIAYQRVNCKQSSEKSSLAHSFFLFFSFLFFSTSKISPAWKVNPGYKPTFTTCHS